VIFLTRHHDWSPEQFHPPMSNVTISATTTSDTRTLPHCQACEVCQISCIMTCAIPLRESGTVVLAPSTSHTHHDAPPRSYSRITNLHKPYTIHRERATCHLASIYRAALHLPAHPIPTDAALRRSILRLHASTNANNYDMWKHISGKSISHGAVQYASYTRLGLFPSLCL
jgi:hypothetical protein